jgi:hypothetical protein
MRESLRVVCLCLVVSCCALVEGVYDDWRRSAHPTSRYRRVVDLGMSEAQKAWPLRATVARTALIHAALESLLGREVSQGGGATGEGEQTALKWLPELRAAESGLDAVLAVLVVDSGDGLSREAEAAFASVASTPAFAGLRFALVDAAYEPEAAISLTRQVPCLLLLSPTEDRLLRISAGRVAGERVLAALANSAHAFLRWWQSFLPQWGSRGAVREAGEGEEEVGGGVVVGQGSTAESSEDGALRVLYGPWAPPPLPRALQQWQRVHWLAGFQESTGSNDTVGDSGVVRGVLGWAAEEVEGACDASAVAVGASDVAEAWLHSLRRFPDVHARSVVLQAAREALQRTLHQWNASQPLLSAMGTLGIVDATAAATAEAVGAGGGGSGGGGSGGTTGAGCWKRVLAERGATSRLQASLDALSMAHFVRWHALDRQARSALSLGKQAPVQRAVRALLQDRSSRAQSRRECESVARVLLSTARARLADAQHLRILPPAHSPEEADVIRTALRHLQPSPSTPSSSSPSTTATSLQDALALVAPSCVEGGLVDSVLAHPLDMPAPPAPLPFSIAGVSGATTHALYTLAIATMVVGIVWTGTALRCAATNRRATWYTLGCLGLLPRPRQPVAIVDVHGRPVVVQPPPSRRRT